MKTKVEGDTRRWLFSSHHALCPCLLMPLCSISTAKYGTRVTLFCVMCEPCNCSRWVRCKEVQTGAGWFSPLALIQALLFSPVGSWASFTGSGSPGSVHEKRSVLRNSLVIEGCPLTRKCAKSTLTSKCSICPAQALTQMEAAAAVLLYLPWSHSFPHSPFLWFQYCIFTW